ncbi:putative G-type lectin S-receptor-like serine/threonine-protein kinase SD2-5-like [Capsicum annuum]|uniref:Protein kinase domain-containing protein n=1 Tax=Capsicum annuum TaxID=4072 RepID=A0A2G2ZFD2_CAPAN|nr:putative G-type lectin S-receptor-like serine/threonine-protein kinase SD2-5-like [Capsicum annuum]KAF3663484.1 putative G-type lectin S-receptor-like serine/threonine-protein kinase SD2-5-like [Capsicum annuum]PHT80713.1 hypothetical protein T459_13728 [Capsicum annuum]
MRGSRGYLAPEWLNSVITKKVYVYAFGIVLLEVLCGRKNLDPYQAYEDVHLLTVFERKADQQQLMDMVDKNNEEMQMHKEAVTEMMSTAAWCLQGNFTKRPSMSLVVKALEEKPLTVQYCLQYYIESNPPKFYYASSSPDSIHFSFDGQTLTALHESLTSPAQFIKLQPDGNLRVYQWDEKVLRLEVISDLSLSYGGNCGYPTVCGRDGICTVDGRYSFPPEENFFMPSDERKRKKNVGCSQVTSINFNSSQNHSFI